MAQATFSIRMDESLKKQFDALCADFGMNATTAFNVFAKAVVRERRIPFEITSPAESVSLSDGRKAFLELRQQAKDNGVQDLTLDEINAEIKSARYGEENV
ncbi:MAG: type II toxin-antitoxin system RelB/DinJ family antitoxin [Clostridia bacterium]